MKQITPNRSAIGACMIAQHVADPGSPINAGFAFVGAGETECWVRVERVPQSLGDGIAP